MHSQLPKGSLITVCVLALIIVAGAVVLFVESSPEGGTAVIAFGVPILGALTQQARLVQTASEVQAKVDHIANGGTESIVRKVVGQEVAKLATAQQMQTSYVPPPEAHEPPSPSTMSGGSNTPPGQMPPAE